MALFYTDSLVLVCANLDAEKEWWISAFACKQARVPSDWDCPLPSDIALTLPGSDAPSILLSDRSEVESAGYERKNDHLMLFCTNVKKAQEHLRARNVPVGPVQESGTQFFEVHDPEGNVIEICKEP